MFTISCCASSPTPIWWSFLFRSKCSRAVMAQEVISSVLRVYEKSIYILTFTWVLFIDVDLTDQMGLIPSQTKKEKSIFSTYLTPLQTITSSQNRYNTHKDRVHLCLCPSLCRLAISRFHWTAICKALVSWAEIKDPRNVPYAQEAYFSQMMWTNLFTSLFFLFVSYPGH
jgi:hypothetical protein